MTDDRMKDLSDLEGLLPDDWEGSEEQEAHRRRERRRRLPRLHLRLEKKGRRGKTVTVISGFKTGEEELETYASELKSRCGTGGTVKEGTIELQGDHRERAGTYFREEGYEVTGIPGG
ncbi:MAG: translation initiation factor [bacterium]